MHFNDVLQAVEQMSIDDQETIIAILQRRCLSHRRALLAREIKEAREEFQKGECPARSPTEILQEILS